MQLCISVISKVLNNFHSKCVYLRFYAMWYIHCRSKVAQTAWVCSWGITDKLWPSHCFIYCEGLQYYSQSTLQDNILKM